MVVAPPGIVNVPDISGKAGSKSAVESPPLTVMQRKVEILLRLFLQVYQKLQAISDYVEWWQAEKLMQ